MIAFKKQTLIQRLLMLIPSYKRKRDKELEDAIRTLIKNPSMPCMVGDEIIANGYGRR